MKQLILATSALLLSTACVTDQQTESFMEESSLTSEVETMLAAFKTALEGRDFETLESLLSDDFVYQEPGVPALSKEGLLEREKRGASGGPVSEVNYSVLDATETGARIESAVQLSFETLLPKDGETIVFTGIIDQDLILVRQEGAMLFQAVTVNGQTLFRNGEPVGPEAIVEMHAGDS